MISEYYSFFVFVHIVSGGMYVVTMIIMQLVVSNMMGRIPPGAGKDAAVEFLKTSWHPIVDIVIVVAGVSGAMVASVNSEMILQNSTLQWKLCFGSVSLLAAYANHFFFRYLKRNLVSSGKNPEALKRLNLVTKILDKAALLFGVSAAFLGVGMNHL